LSDTKRQLKTPSDKTSTKIAIREIQGVGSQASSGFSVFAAHFWTQSS
jgi:hypothetical protein